MPSTSMALPSTPSSTNLCSEVCSGYATAAPTPGAGASAELGARLPHDPRDHAPMLSARPSATAGGFHWGDAGIGAGGAVALMVLLSGGFVVLTNLRHRGAHSAA
jgi:hypothetical protein